MSDNCLTPGFDGPWAGRDNAALSEPALSPVTASKRSDFHHWVHHRRTRTSSFPKETGSMGVYCEVADTKAVQSIGDMPLAQSCGAPWFPLRMIHPLVAPRPRLESYKH